MFPIGLLLLLYMWCNLYLLVSIYYLLTILGDVTLTALVLPNMYVTLVLFVVRGWS